MGSHASTKSRPAKSSSPRSFARGLAVLAVVAIVVAIFVVKIAG